MDAQFPNLNPVKQKQRSSEISGLISQGGVKKIAICRIKIGNV